MKFLHANWVDSIALKIPRLIEIDNEQVVHPGARMFHGTLVKERIRSPLEFLALLLTKQGTRISEKTLVSQLSAIP